MVLALPPRMRRRIALTTPEKRGHILLGRRSRLQFDYGMRWRDDGAREGRKSVLTNERAANCLPARSQTTEKAKGRDRRRFEAGRMRMSSQKDDGPSRHRIQIATCRVVCSGNAEYDERGRPGRQRREYARHPFGNSGLFDVCLIIW